MTQSSENKIVKSTRQWNLANIITVIGMCLGGIGYMENTKTQIIAEIHKGAIDHTELKGRVLQLESRTAAMEKFQDRVETYFDKPKPIDHKQKETD